MPIVPPGHKVVLVKSAPTPFFERTASGPMVLNFGTIEFIPEGLSTLRTFLASTTERQSVLWLMPASILPAFVSSELLQQVAALTAGSPLVSHVAVFPNDSPLRNQVMAAFKNMGIGAQLGAPDGTCYVEVHKPDGSIVVGIPGPEQPPKESETPLSDLITAARDSGTGASLDAVYAAFLEAHLGLIVLGAPADARGGYQTTSHDHFTMPAVQGPDGRRMIKACADPKVFAKRYEPNLNATMTGRALAEMALKMPHCEGILLCSAASEHSLPIGRAKLLELLGAGIEKPQHRQRRF